MVRPRAGARQRAAPRGNSELQHPQAVVGVVVVAIVAVVAVDVVGVVVVGVVVVVVECYCFIIIIIVGAVGARCLTISYVLHNVFACHLIYLPFYSIKR